MPIKTADGLVDSVRELELIECDRIAEFDSLAERASNPNEMVAQLFKRELLTAFQINRVAQGKGKELILGPYVLLDKIGAGGMGEVFKARHRRLHRVAAVKVVRPARLARGNTLQRFLREAESAAKLSHPNIVTVYDFAAEGETHYLAMEYVDGVDLSRLLGQTGPLPVPLACDFIRQAALGLHHAHEKGFVHRDVKPSNLLVAPRGPRRPDQLLEIETYTGGTVKILDMGLIRIDPNRPSSQGLALTQLGVVIGTLDYLSPEQALNAHQVDRRADLYSLGCTLYHLLAGHVPFADGLPMDKLLRHQTEQAAPLSESRPDVSPELESLLGSLLAKRPEDRIQTAAEVADAMAVFAGKSGPIQIPLAQPVSPENVFADLDLDGGATTDVVKVRQTTNEEFKPRPPSRAIRLRKDNAKPEKHRWRLAGAAFVLVFALAAPTLLNKPAPATHAPSSSNHNAIVDRLHHYVPPETAAILNVQPRPFLTAPIFLLASKHPPLDPGAIDLLNLLGVEPRQSVDWIRFHFPSGDIEQALWLARGRFEDDLFSRAKNLLSPVKSGPDARPGLFRYSSGPNSRFAGHLGDYVLGGGQSKHLAAALDHARKDSEIVPFDALKELVDRADRKKHLWLVVACPLLGKIGCLTGHKPTDSLWQAMVASAATIEAGLECDENLSLSVRLKARSMASAQEVFDRVKGFQKVAVSLLARSRANEYEKRLWFQLVRQATVSRDGLTVAIDSRVTSTMMQ